MTGADASVWIVAMIAPAHGWSMTVDAATILLVDDILNRPVKIKTGAGNTY